MGLMGPENESYLDPKMDFDSHQSLQSLCVLDEVSVGLG